MADNSFTHYYLASNKERFIVKKENQIKRNELYIANMEKFKNVIASFDGKVLNIKLKRALQEVLTSQELFLHVSGYSCGMGYMYGDFDACSFHINVNSDGRIQSAITIVSIVNRIEKLLVENEIAQDSIANFDAYVEKSRIMEQQIVEYRKSVPSGMQFPLTFNKPYDID